MRPLLEKIAEEERVEIDWAIHTLREFIAEDATCSLQGKRHQLTDYYKTAPRCTARAKHCVFYHNGYCQIDK